MILVPCFLMPPLYPLVEPSPPLLLCINRLSGLLQREVHMGLTTVRARTH